MAIGPVEYLVVAFPGNRFTGTIAPALAELVTAGTVRILDLTFISRAEDGSVAYLELDDLTAADADDFAHIDGKVNGLLNREDLAQVADSIPPGNSAAVVVWEDSWATRLSQAVRASGGVTVAHERIPAEVAERALATAGAS